MSRPGRAGRQLLGRQLTHHRGPLLRILGWSLLEAVPVLLSGLLLSRAVDRFLTDRPVEALTALGGLLLVAAVGALATRALFAPLTVVVEAARDAFLRAVVTGAVVRAAAAPATADAAGIARLTEQVQSVRDTVFALLRTARHVLFSSVAALVGLALLAPPVAALCGVLFVLAMAILVPLLPALARRQRALLLAGEQVAAEAGTILGGMRDALACRARDRAVGQVLTAADREAGLTRALARATALRTLVIFVGGQLPLVLLLAAGPWLVDQGRLSVGELVGAATYLTVSLEPALRGLVGVLGSWGLDLVVTLRRLGETFVADPDRSAGPDGPAMADVPGPSGDDRRRAGRPDQPGYCLELAGLTFSYGPAADPVVRELRLSLAEGEHLAVVGPSGIGKSTLAGLVAGLLPPTAGTVRLGGTPVADLPRPELRRAVGLIPQQAYVFAGTLRENLDYLAPQVGTGELTRAADAVGLTPLIDRLGGLDAPVDPAALSHGERQLIALTRTYLSPARIVILDEATANLDPAAEQRAERAFARRAGTLVVIAHRISSARRADRILLLDGDRATIGSHEEVLASSPLYRELTGQWAAGAVRPPARDVAAGTPGLEPAGQGVRPASANGQ